MKERWLPVVGYEGLYEVSNTGRVAGLVRGGILSPSFTNNYAFVHLSADGERTTIPVHRLVLEAFDRPRPGGLECRHLDGDSTNNNHDNLLWGTRSENQMDRADHGTSNRGERCGASKLTEPDVHRIRSLLSAGLDSGRKIARTFGVDEATIRRIKSGKIWSWLTEAA